MIHVSLIPILPENDNYAFLLEADNGETAVVDPGDAAPIIAFLKERDIFPDMVLITHHHWDHVDGLHDLLAWHYCHVYGPTRAGSFVNDSLTQILEEGSEFSFGGEDITIFHTPGHAREHLCYYFPSSGFLLAGDTIFAMGCGRLIDGTAEEMYQSLQKIVALPDQTNIYCGHEYTLSNARFCTTIAPDNIVIEHRLHEVQDLHDKQEPTIPTTLAQEKETNVFLHAKSAAEFAALRKAKDSF